MRNAVILSSLIFVALLPGCGDRSPPMPSMAGTPKDSPSVADSASSASAGRSQADPPSGKAAVPPTVAHGVWKCSRQEAGRKILAELAMFPDGHFIVHEQGKDVAGSYRIDGRKLSGTVIAGRGAGKNADWSPVSSPTDGQRKVLDHEITDTADSSLTLLPVHVPDQAGGSVREKDAETCIPDFSLLAGYEAMRRAIPGSLLPVPNYELGAGVQVGKDRAATKRGS